MATETQDEISKKVQESLKDSLYACSTLTKLSGGTANFVYRGALTTPLSDGTKTVVIKHTEAYVASNPDFKLTDSRCEYEHSILTALSSFPPVVHSGILVQTPHLYLFNKETNTQVYSDLPSSLDLKTYVLTHHETLTEAQCQRLGRALGEWCRSFHVWANSPQQTSLREVMKGNKAMQDLKYSINYDVLLATVDVFPEILGEKKALLEEVAKKVKTELEARDGELIHGDFWSGNVLLPSTPIPSPSSSIPPLKVFILDWELSQLSLPFFDLGQMLAELYELHHFKHHSAGLWLMQSFISGYGEMDEEMKWMTILHTGVHLVCWGSRVAGWGTKEQVEDVVRTGRDWIVGAWERRREVFEGMVLGGLLG
ncbi:hypothetical protein EG329_005309 [Mollisiaceae sp. DMI_Dod_QoI]|nr:hypothetical protein EG329_005309 [Helotiales sp. DMI_Dod_QoI]